MTGAMAGAGQDGGDLDLSHWLRPGEIIRWTGRPARARVPWLIVIGIGVGSVIAGGVLAGINPGGSRTPPIFLIFIAIVVVINVVNVVRMVRRAYRAAELNRYVLTTQRAAIFETPGRLVAETRADSAEFLAKRSPTTRAGDIDWGESNYQEPEARGPLAALSRMNTLRYSPGEGKVVFAQLANFDAGYHMASAVRADLGVRTPPPVSPKVRGQPPVALGALDKPAAGVINTIALCVGSVAIACVVALLGWTLFGPAKDFMSSPAVLLFVLIFPLFFWAIAIAIGRSQRAGEALQLSGRRVRRRMGQSSGSGIPLPLNYLPRWAIGAVIAVFVACWISGLLVFGGNNLQGVPEYHPATHTYTVDNHGDEIVVSKAKYDSAVRAQDRLFLSIELAFMVAAVAMASDELIRRRRSPFIHSGVIGPRWPVPTR